jgi:hypothetical protein
MIEEKKEKESHEGEKRKRKTESQVPLPFCTTASDSEHARGYEEDEPCDDSRSGEIESTDEQEETTIEKETKSE